MFKQLQKRLGSGESYVSLGLGFAVMLVIGTIVFNIITKHQATLPQNLPEGDKEAQQLGKSHTVAAGETLWSIAEKYYKSGYNWIDLAQANNLTNPDQIEISQVLAIPTVVPRGEQISATTTDTTTTKKTYVVKSGDNLWNIAVAQYNNGYKWVEIAKANVLANPDLIHSGNEFILP